MSKFQYGQIILFGDSLIEYSGVVDDGFGLTAALQAAYLRRLDVVNRGFDGYNTSQALQVLRHVIPGPSAAGGPSPPIRLLVVLLGANDATSPSAPNDFHVPLEQYKFNLRAILTHPSVIAHAKPSLAPSAETATATTNNADADAAQGVVDTTSSAGVAPTRLLLVTPPPINEHQHAAKDRAAGHPGLTRFSASARTYAEGCREVGAQMGVPVVDLWSRFMSEAGWEQDGGRGGAALIGERGVEESSVLKRMLSDGVHLSADGYRVFYDELMSAIKSNWPDLLPDQIPFVLPPYDKFTEGLED